MPTVTINVVGRGAPLASGEKSTFGHMWYAVTDDQGESRSFGFAPDEQHEGDPFAPGQVYFDDSSNYLTRRSARTIPVTQEQYRAMLDFGQDPTAFGFSMRYNGLSNNCIDFTWRALEVGGLNPSGFKGDLLPTQNIDEIAEISPLPLDPAAARHTDLHVCPLAPSPGLPIGPPCATTVLIAGLPAAREGDRCVCAGAPSDGVDAISRGENTVTIEGLPAARIGDPTQRGGNIIGGCTTVHIGSSQDTAFEHEFRMMTGMELSESIERFEEITGESISEQTVQKLFSNPDFAEQYLTERALAHSVYRGILNTNIPKTEAEAIALGYEKQSFFGSLFHDPWNNSKYVSADGHREAVYDENGDLVHDERYRGTFNFFGPKSFFDHQKADIDPYNHWKGKGVY